MPQAVKTQLAASNDENSVLKHKLQLLSARQDTSEPTARPNQQQLRPSSGSTSQVVGSGPEEGVQQGNTSAEGQSQPSRERSHRNAERDAEVRSLINVLGQAEIDTNVFCLAITFVWCMTLDVAGHQKQVRSGTGTDETMGTIRKSSLDVILHTWYM